MPIKNRTVKTADIDNNRDTRQHRRKEEGQQQHKNDDTGTIMNRVHHNNISTNKHMEQMK